jgi:hypothetical protein
VLVDPVLGSTVRAIEAQHVLGALIHAIRGRYGHDAPT